MLAVMPTDTLTSLGNNIDSGWHRRLGRRSSCDQVNTDPMLGALQDNGGLHQDPCTAWPGAVAINAGTATGAPAVDQRGVTRDAIIDIGGYEHVCNTTNITSYESGGQRNPKSNLTKTGGRLFHIPAVAEHIRPTN